MVILDFKPLNSSKDRPFKLRLPFFYQNVSLSFLGYYRQNFLIQCSWSFLPLFFQFWNLFMTILCIDCVDFQKKWMIRCWFTLQIFSVSSILWPKMAIFWGKILQNRYHSLKITLSCYTSLKAEFWEDFDFLRVKASKRTQKIKLCFNLKKNSGASFLLIAFC